MPCYRHNKEEIIYYLTDKPDVALETYKGKPYVWTVSGEIRTDYSHNPVDPETHSLKRPTIKAAVTDFLVRDSKEEAVSKYFRRWAPSDSTEITPEEYDRLLRQYSQTNSSSGNKKPDVSNTTV